MQNCKLLGTQKQTQDNVAELEVRFPLALGRLTTASRHVIKLEQISFGIINENKKWETRACAFNSFTISIKCLRLSSLTS